MTGQRTTEERARYMLRRSTPRMIRSRLQECETVEDVREWMRVYNEFREQLPPSKKPLLGDMVKRSLELETEAES